MNIKPSRCYAFRCPVCNAEPGALCRARFGRGKVWMDTHWKRRALVLRHQPPGPVARRFIARGLRALRARRKVLASRGDWRVLRARRWLVS